jgi:D-aminopeptidase
MVSLESRRASDAEVVTTSAVGKDGPSAADPSDHAQRGSFQIGSYRSGPTKSIVDVCGVRVGHTTVTDGMETFSGATAIVIDGVSPAAPTRAAIFVGNGHGKFIGATQVSELGEAETPIVLTSTLSAFRAADAIVTWVLRQHGAATRSINPVVGEINDSWLSTDPRPVTTDHVIAAIDAASSEPFAVGNVGGGTGACALGFKGGIGSASRILTIGGQDTTIGTLVQANMSGLLRTQGRTISAADLGLSTAGPETETGSCVIVVAVDAPLDGNLLRRIAARAVYALARVGAGFSHGSGDYALAFSTSGMAPAIELTNSEMTSVFEAAMDTVEEAVLDALAAANTTTSMNGHTAHALPLGNYVHRR